MQRSGDEVQHDPRKLSEKEEEKSEDDEDAERSGAQQGRAGGLPDGTRERLPLCGLGAADACMCLLPGRSHGLLTSVAWPRTQRASTVEGPDSCETDRRSLQSR